MLKINYYPRFSKKGKTGSPHVLAVGSSQRNVFVVIVKK